jgi:hypothetical protein
MSVFQHSPLESPANDIRLLQLHASCDGDDQPISCTIVHTPLAESPPYVALSYTWGNESPTETILVNDTLIQVRQNLYCALRSLRHESISSALWVDALCINQKDAEEKAHQVQNMKRIFQTAVIVIGWLGQPTHGNDQALSRIGQIGKAFEELGGQEAIWRLNRSAQQQDSAQQALAWADLERILAQVDDIFNDGGLFPTEALYDLQRRDYWSRLWILQEICVARELEFIYGTGRIRSSHFFAAFGFYCMRLRQIVNKFLALQNAKSPADSKLSDFEQSMMPRIPLKTKLGTLIGARRGFQRNQQGGDETLLQLAIRANVQVDPGYSMGVKDPKDRIYALLGVAKDCDDLAIKLDYRESTKCGEVYTNVALSWLRSGQIDILALCQFPKFKDDFESSLPTWVPDLRGPIRRPCGGYRENSLFAAAGETQQHVGVESCYQKIIQLRGTVVDTIQDAGSAWNPEKNLDSSGNYIFNYAAAGILFEEVEDFVKTSFCKRDNVYQPDTQLEELVWRIPVADQDLGTLVEQRANSGSRQGYEDAKRAIQIGPEEQARHSDIRTAYTRTMEYCHNRRPFLSTKGYVGLAPADAQGGDLICILLGAYLPFILRTHEDRKTVELIGEAYVHGIMDGEFMETDPRIDTFTLR